MRLILKRSFNVDNALRAFEYVRVFQRGDAQQIIKVLSQDAWPVDSRNTREIVRMEYDEIRVLDRPSSSRERSPFFYFCSTCLRVKRSRYKISPQYVRVWDDSFSRIVVLHCLYKGFVDLRRGGTRHERNAIRE